MVMSQDWILILTGQLLITCAAVIGVYRCMRGKLLEFNEQVQLTAAKHLQQQGVMMHAISERLQQIQNWKEQEQPVMHVVVNTLPKVGSTSTVITLRQAIPNAVVEQFHGLSLEAQKDVVQQIQQEGIHGFNEVREMHTAYLWHLIQFRQKLERLRTPGGGNAGVYFVCGVREPISWCLSCAFENHSLGLIPDEALTPEQVKLSIMKTMRHVPDEADARDARCLNLAGSEWTSEDDAVQCDPLEAWCEQEMRAYPGLNPLEAGFDTHRGFHVYESPMGRLLVIRQESLARLPEALAELLTLPQDLFKDWRANVSEEKKHADLYRGLRSRLRFPVSFLEELYARPYSSTFYSAEERNAFIKQWSE